MNPTLTRQDNCMMFIIGDDIGDMPIDVPVTITELIENGKPIYQAVVSLENIDGLIEQLKAVRNN